MVIVYNVGCFGYMFWICSVNYNVMNFMMILLGGTKSCFFKLVFGKYMMYCAFFNYEEFGMLGILVVC